MGRLRYKEAGTFIRKWLNPVVNSEYRFQGLAFLLCLVLGQRTLIQTPLPGMAILGCQVRTGKAVTEVLGHSWEYKHLDSDQEQQFL